MVTLRRRGAFSVPMLLALLLVCTLAVTGGASAQTGPTSVDGFVFNDANSNDLPDRGDLPIPGAGITLRDAGGNPLASTATDAAGHFQFFNLARGIYLVSETDPPGFGSVDAVPGSAAANVDLNTVRISMVDGVNNYSGTVFLDRQMAVPPTGPNIILGSVFDDKNANRFIDVGEPPLAGVLVTMLDAGNNPIGTRLTSGTGDFAFSGLAAGTYTVLETDPAGLASVAAIAGTGGQVVDANTIRVTTTGGTVRYAGHIFLDQSAQGSPIPQPLPTSVLQLTKAVDRAAAEPGDVLTYTLTAVNGGTAASDRAALFDAVPPGTQFVDASSGGALSADTVVWVFGSLPINASVVVSFRVRVLTGGIPGSLIQNQAQLVVPAQSALVNSNTVTTLVGAAGSPLVLGKTADRSFAQPGDIVTFTLTYANLSGVPVSAVIVDPLANGLNFVDAQANVEIDIATRSLRFNRGTLAPGAVGTITFRAQVDASALTGTPLTNQARIESSALAQPLLSNGVTVTVGASAFAGTYQLIQNATNPSAITVDRQNKFTVISVPGDRQTPGRGGQGTLNPDGSFDVTTVDGQVRFTGRVDANSQTATITVQRANLAPYTVTLPRAPDVNPLSEPLVGTFQGYATNPTGDRLSVLLSIDPQGNATFAGRVIQPFIGARGRAGAYQVTPDGRLTSGGQTDGTIQAAGGALTLSYTFNDGSYQASFQAPLIRQ
jgi:uncharacterized repeat protein (TIGR01451 family)